jgi:hypothetical protein
MTTKWLRRPWRRPHRSWVERAARPLERGRGSRLATPADGLVCVAGASGSFDGPPVGRVGEGGAGPLTLISCSTGPVPETACCGTRCAPCTRCKLSARRARQISIRAHRLPRVERSCQRRPAGETRQTSAWLGARVGPPRVLYLMEWWRCWQRLADLAAGSV